MPNRLANSSSPYLRQHAGNPVDWEEWGERALERARTEDKPILLSVGYAACHWCHVMAHESFENEEIARQINEGFVAVKVDREERPDIDQIYQHAVQLLGVGGGWPLTAFLAPDGRPFYGGTYFPPDDRYGRPGFRRVLAGVREAWTERRDQVHDNAAELTAAVKESEALPPESGEVIGDVFGTAATTLLRRVDPVNGGFGGAPKFPNTMAVEVLLRHARRTDAETSRHAALWALGKMAEGGIYDHVGGGFHRYSVDERWHVPHFEKMLYDNALLARAYVQGWQLTKLPWCRQVAEETLDYLLREMRSPEGTFYASTDADSAPPADPQGHPEEGEFFVWTEKEVLDLLGPDDGRIFSLRFGVEGGSGNWEHGKNVLFVSRRESEVAEKVGRTEDEVRASLARSRTLLYEARAKRPPPFRDEKLLTAWNALAVSAFALAGAAFDRTDYLDAARRAAESMLRTAWVSGGGAAAGTRRLLRTPDPGEGRATILGTLDDYGGLAEALLDLHDATLEPAWLDPALALGGDALRLFAGDGDAAGELYLTGTDAETLVHRPLSLHDQSTPAGSGLIVSAWLRLSRLLGRNDLERAARRTLDRYRLAMKAQPFAFGTMLNAWDSAEHPVDVVFAGPTSGEDAAALLRTVHGTWIPGGALHVATDPPRSPLAADKPPQDGRTTVYVCRDRTCSLPVTAPEALAPLL